MNLRILFLYLFLFGSLLNTFAQSSTVFFRTERKNYNFRNNSHPDTSDYITSYFIKQMALVNGKTNAASAFALKYNLKRIIKKQSGKIFAVVLIDPVDITGSYNYRAFSIKDVLYPSEAAFNLTVIGDNDQIVINKKVKCKRKEGKFKTVIPIENTHKHPELIIDKIHFYFTVKDKKRFNEKCGQINDYYASCNIIDSLLSLITLIGKSNELDLAEQLVYIFDLRQVYKKLESKEFVNELHIEKHDPLNYYNSLYDFKLKINRMETLYKQSVENLPDHELIWPERIVDLYVSQLDYYIDIAKKADHYFTSTYNDLINREYGNEAVLEIEEEISRISNNKINKTKCVFAETLFVGLTEFAEECINSEMYNEALILLNNLEDFCNSTSCDCRIKEVYKKISRAEIGLYFSFLKIAYRAIEIRNYQLAQTYINKAKDFRQNNKKYIVSEIAIDRVYTSMAQSYLDYGVELNDKNKYEKSLNMLNKSQKLISLYPDVHINENRLKAAIYIAKQGIYQDYLAMASHYFNLGNYKQARICLNKAQPYYQSEDVLNSIKDTSEEDDNVSDFPTYLSLVSEGEKLMIEGEYEEALIILSKAKSVNQYNNTTKPIDSLIQQAARNYAEKLIYNASVALWKDDLGTAIKITKTVDNLVADYDLLGFPELKKFYFDLNTNLDKLMCRFKRFEFNSLIENGYKNIQRHDFNGAYKKFHEAIDLAEAYEKCDINDSIAHSSLMKYKPAIRYQQKFAEIKDLLFEEGFQNVIENYIKLDNYYKEANLEVFGITHLSLRDFLWNQRNPQLILASYRYYMNNGNNEEALQMLQLLRKQEYDAYKTKKMQKGLAKKLAIKDFENENTNNYSEVMRSYYNDKQWFRYFRRVYKWIIFKNKIRDFFKRKE